MKDPMKVKDLILKEIDFSRVLLDYHVEFTYSPELMDTVQLRCPFHGQDNKPSARYYRDSQSVFCWVCRERWDVIGFIMNKENLPFISALFYIVNRYQLDISVIPDDPELLSEKKKTVSVVSVKVINAEKKLKGLRNSIVPEKYGILVIAYYMILYKSSKGNDVTEDIDKFNKKLDTIKMG